MPRASGPSFCAIGITPYGAAKSAPVTTARVAATGAITWQTDPQVSAHATLGAITRVVASLDPPDRAIDRGIFTARLAQAPNLGLDVSSDMFRLHEGRLG